MNATLHEQIGVRLSEFHIGVTLVQPVTRGRKIELGLARAEASNRGDGAKSA